MFKSTIFIGHLLFCVYIRQIKKKLLVYLSFCSFIYQKYLTEETVCCQGRDSLLTFYCFSCFIAI